MPREIATLEDSESNVLMRRTVTGPCVMVIFGASGDLTSRKLVPALYNLVQAGLLSDQFAVVGVARDQLTTEQFRDAVTKFIPQEEKGSDHWQWFVKRLHYMSGEFSDAGLFSQLGERLKAIDQEFGTEGNYFFYLATSPTFFGEIVERLGEAKLAQQDGHWRRVVIEKPFGRDLDGARALNRQILKVLEENQVYRIDHYLGKETVQNIMVFRFGNGIFEPIWNRQYIDHVQITVAETVGVEQRGGYFDSAGTLRDMVPNHIFQLITLTSMEPPSSFDANAVRDEQAKVLHAVQPLRSEDVLERAVRGQYGDGMLEGKRVPAYRSEPNVAADSRTETFVAAKILIDNWRWAGVPFYLRTGKRMAKRHTEIVINFKKAPFMMFRDTSVQQLQHNHLVMYIAPEEGIALRFGAKIPGPLMRMDSVDMDFRYSDYFGTKPSTGYEILLYDCMMGDATLFQRADMVEASWSVVDPILDVWKALPPRIFPNYAAGSWGPKEAGDLLTRDGRRWRRIPE